MEGGEGFRITDNRVVRNGAGITLGPGSHNVITGNRVSHGSDGIRIEKGHGNLVAHNVVAHTRRAGIRLGIPHPFLGGAHNVVRRNLVRDSGDDGFWSREGRHSLLKNNVARGCGRRRLRRREPLDEADEQPGGPQRRPRDRGGARRDDGGGNVARHNGDPRQCVNVKCH